MKQDRLSVSIVVLGILLTILTVWLGGCSSTPPQRPDRERIQQDSEKGMQDLKREEERRRDSDY